MDPLILCFYATVFIAPASILAGVVALAKIHRLKRIYGPIVGAERELARINKEIEKAKLDRDKMIADNSNMLARFRERQEGERERLEMTGDEIPSKTVFTRATTTLAQPEESSLFAPTGRPRARGSSVNPADGFHFSQPSSASALHRQRIALAAASALGAIATFLPWAYAPIFGSILGSASPEGWISLILFLPSLFLAFAGNMRTPLVGPGRVISTVTAAIASACGIWTIADFQMQSRNSAKADSLETAFMMLVQMGSGVYLCIASGLAVIVLAWTLDGALAGERETRWGERRLPES